MLATHLACTINQDPYLLRVLGVDTVTDTTDWAAPTHTTYYGALSPGEQALAMCLYALGGADVPNSFGHWFEHLDAAGRRSIVTILDTYADTATTTEMAAQSTRPLFEV